MKLIVTGITGIWMINCAPAPGTYYLQDNTIQYGYGSGRDITTTTNNCITTNLYDEAGTTIISAATTSEKKSRVMDSTTMEEVDESFSDAACATASITEKHEYDFTMGGSLTTTLYTASISDTPGSSGEYLTSYTYESVDGTIMYLTQTGHTITCHTTSDCTSLAANYNSFTDLAGNSIPECSSLVFNSGSAADVSDCDSAYAEANGYTDFNSTFLGYYKDEAENRLYFGYYLNADYYYE